MGWLTLADQDAVFWFFPAYKLIAEQVRSGVLPLWNPYFYSGAPLFAQWQAGVLDPLNWLFWVKASARTLTLVQELSFSLALLALFAYARALGFRRRAAVVAAVIYALSGFAVARVLYPGFLHVVALTPLVFYFIERIYQRSRWRDATLGALIVAWQLFAAHPQPFVYSALLAAAYALFTAVFRSGGRTSLPFLAKCLSLYVGGVGLSAIQLFPAWEFARGSVRQEWSYELFTLHSLHPLSLLTTLFPFFHGSGKTPYQLKFWGAYWHHNEAQIYLGALALALAGAGALAAWRARWRVGLFWSGVALLGVLLSLGKYVEPVASLLYRAPLLSQFRSPNRHWLEVLLAVAVLAGWAVDRLLTAETACVLVRDVRVLALALALFCCGLGGFVLAQRDAAERFVRTLPDLALLPNGFLNAASAEFYLPMLIAVLACVTLFAFTHLRTRAWGYALLLAILLADYNLYAAFAPINTAASLDQLLGRAIPFSLAAQQNERAPFRYHLLLSPADGEFSPFDFYGHELASGYDPLLNTLYKTFSGVDEAGRSHLPSLLEAQDRTLDLLNVRYVLTPSNSAAAQEQDIIHYILNSKRWKIISVGDDSRALRIYENQQLLPRAWLIDQIMPVWEYDQLRIIRGEWKDPQGREFAPETTALTIRDTTTPQPWYERYAAGAGLKLPPVKIITRTPTHLVLETEADCLAVLVLSEIYYPGWRAQVNGENREVRRVNYALRGVEVGAGKQRVELSYEPATLKAGAVVSLTTALVLLLLVFWESRKSQLRDAGVL